MVQDSTTYFSLPTQPTSRTLTRHLQRSLPIQTSLVGVSRRKHGTVLLVSKSYHTIRLHCSSKHMTWQQKLWQRQEKNTTMTSNEQALFAMMQELGYSHGLCISALQILSQDRLAVSEMLAYLYEEQPSEEVFIKDDRRQAHIYSHRPEIVLRFRGMRRTWSRSAHHQSCCCKCKKYMESKHWKL